MSQFKLVLLGETAVGKSSVALRFARDQFLEYQESTIGAAFLTQSVVVDGNPVKFEIWDTAGQERYHSLAPMVSAPCDLCGAARRRRASPPPPPNGRPRRGRCCCGRAHPD